MKGGYLTRASCGRKRWNNGRRNIDILRGNCFRKEAGCRNDSSTLVGRMRVSAKSVTRRKGQKSTGSAIVENGTVDSRCFQKVGANSENLKEGVEWQRGIVAHLLSESQWNRGHFSLKKWESEKRKSWSMPAEGFKGHVATDGSLLGTAGKWGACGWSVAQLDYDEEVGPLHGMYASMEAVLEVQRTIKRAELTAFLCLLKRVIGPVRVHVDTKGIIDGLRRGESKCIKPRAGDADLG